MSNPNEKSTPPEEVVDSITINDSGEVVINDPDLAKMTEELSAEEIAAVAGGFQKTEAFLDGNCGCR